ncbi:hypothetical protein QBC35DRAFT_483443 [Podospora australis]|uniref:Sm domain-containing protein n=1 Tax=Podospora australis TaxID=1536484 RepID=A0AAN6X384_9PEZI|nr:hypothetical protein QBC35DRAFT_483443 [Podospora australis]
MHLFDNYISSSPPPTEQQRTNTAYFAAKRRNNLPIMDYDALPTPSTKAEANDFLQTLLNKNLRVTTTDGRMFWGSFKCTDPESNLILRHTYEYRPPTSQQIAEAKTSAAFSSEGLISGDGSRNSNSGISQKVGGGSKVKIDMTSRYLGLVAVPGKHIARIEVEEFSSQLKRKRKEGDTASKESGKQPDAALEALRAGVPTSC